ncbi:hypothetical protein, partial [Escherichia coli]|uniref:hypothetical protein n=2 Tax=Escherichia coli TaxID=562 RepID=UPI00112BC2C5
MSHWPECSVAAESRRGEVASILRETEQKTAIHTLNQSEPSSLMSLYIDLCNCLILICSIQHQMKVN